MQFMKRLVTKIAIRELLRCPSGKSARCIANGLEVTKTKINLTPSIIEDLGWRDWSSLKEKKKTTTDEAATFSCALTV